MKTLRTLLCIGGVLASTWTATATPYASGVTNNNGTIQFYLNEAPTSAYVIFENGASNNIASPAVGLNSFALGSHSSYAIYVSKNGSGVPSVIPLYGNSTNYEYYPYPRGVAVNINPTNGAVFGTVYISSSGTGIAGNTISKGHGLYALHSDYSLAFGTPSTGLEGAEWANSGTSGPYKISVNMTDNTLWSSDYSAANAGIYYFDPFLKSAATQVLAGVGSSAGIADGTHGLVQGKPLPFGSTALGNLVVWDFDATMASVASNSLGGENGALSGYGSPEFNYHYSYTVVGGTITAPGNIMNAFQYTIGNGPLPWANAPDFAIAMGLNYSGALGEEDVAPDGKIFIAAERDAFDSPVLSTYDSTGTTNLFCSQTGGAADAFATGTVTNSYGYDTQSAFSVKVSPDDRYVAVLGYVGWLALLNLTNGVPDVSTLTVLPSSIMANAAAGRQIGWDAADNLYIASSGTATVLPISLGLTATCITSNDATGLNGSFALAIPSAIVSVIPTTPLASQNYGTPIPGMFTITNSGSTASAVTINFTLTGTATNGTTYTISANGVTLPASTTYSVTIPEGQNTINLTVNPSESIASAATLYSTLSLVGSSYYAATLPTVATVTIVNTGPQVLAITGTPYPSMYRGISNDFAGVTVTRYGDTNVATYTIPASAFTYGGTATVNTDYAPSQGITVTNGDQSEVATVSNPVWTGKYVGNESITVALNAGGLPAGVTVSGGTEVATLTLIDDANPPETVLWSDPLTSAADSVNWTLTFANSNLSTTTVAPIVIPNYPNYTASNPDPNGLDDFDVEFGYSLASDGVGQSPMMVASNITTALKMTVNKNSGYVNSHGASAGVNLYPQGKNFSGNYAMRFSMNLSVGTTSTTEYDSFGVNSYGTNCNWFASDYGYGSGTTNSDGVWYWVDSDTDGNGLNLGFVEVCGTNLPNTGYTVVSEVDALNFSDIFKSPVPYNTVPGGPADGNGNPANTWSDVEVKQFNGVLTLSINKTPIIITTNTSVYKSGDIWLGYDDPYASVGTVASSFAPGAAVYYSNLRIVSLAGPTITSVTRNGSNLLIMFTSPDADAGPSAFSVQSASKLVNNGTVFATTASTITQSGSTYTATIPYSASTTNMFYRVIQSDLTQ